MKALISLIDIQKYRNVSRSIPQDRLLPFIIESQIGDLKPIMGDEFFYDFILKFDDSGASEYSLYQNLLNGMTYTPNGSSYAVEFYGIIPLLSFYTLARLHENNQTNVTRFGIVTKQTDESNPMATESISGGASTLRSTALMYEENLRYFLNFYVVNSISPFTLYQYRQTTPINNSGAKFFNV